MKSPLVKIHAIAASLALLMITLFFISTLVSELFGSTQQIIDVKNTIFYAIWFLIPFIAMAGISGVKLSGGVKKGLIGKKFNRMPFIAMNGIFILVPAAIYLRSLAIAGEFNMVFYIVQAVELFAGLTNIVLMSLNFRDGLKVSKAKSKLAQPK